MLDFDRAIEKFQTKELNVSCWHFASESNGDGTYTAYIMGEGAEQCLAYKDGFKSRAEIEKLFKSIGARYILPGVG